MNFKKNMLSHKDIYRLFRFQYDEIVEICKTKK